MRLRTGNRRARKGGIRCRHLVWWRGFGLAGGGFGDYKVCGRCGRVFDKELWGDDEE